MGFTNINFEWKRKFFLKLLAKRQNLPQEFPQQIPLTDLKTKKI
jgi:hypothetical protein